MKHRMRYIILIIFAAAAMNNVLQQFQFWLFDWPLYLDSVFTITVGIFFGWIPGVLTGLLTNLMMEVIDGFQGLDWPFAIVNMMTGLIAGLISADKEKYWTIERQILMVLALTVSNTLLGAYIVNVVFGGTYGDTADILVSALLLMGKSKVVSSTLARIPINLVDKGVPVLVIFVIHRYHVKKRLIIRSGNKRGRQTDGAGNLHWQKLRGIDEKHQNVR